VPTPGPHPLPPARLFRTRLPLHVTAQSWFRLHAFSYGAIYWGLDPPRPEPFRFDAPAHEFGILYAGEDPHCAFIETFGHNTGATRRISAVDLASRSLSRIDVARPVRLVDLTGPNAAVIGVDARLYAGEYKVSQHWSLAFHQHRDAPDGIYYPSRHDSDRCCVALFDRVADAVAAVALPLLTEPSQRHLLADIVRRYRFAVHGL